MTKKHQQAADTIITVSRIVLSDEDRAGPGLESARSRAATLSQELDALTSEYGPAAAAAIRAGLQADREFTKAARNADPRDTP